MKPLVAIALIAIAAASARAEDKKPTDSLQGEWKVVTFTVTATDLPQDQIDNMKVAVSGDVMTWTFAKTKKELAITMALGPKAKPATIDLTWVEGGKEGTVPGIYKVEKDTFTICYEHNSEGKRPKEFKSDDGGRTMLLVMQRVKK